MIWLLPSPSATATAPPVAIVTTDRRTTSRIYESGPQPGPPLIVNLEPLDGHRVEIKPSVEGLVEEFDWTQKKVISQYVKLEQRILAKLATEDERELYHSMK